MAAKDQRGGRTAPVVFPYHTLRSVTSPEDQDAGRRRYCGIAPASSLFRLGTSENVRDYLGRDQLGQKRKSTQVNIAIRNTLDSNREQFPLLNAGVVIVARDVKVDDGTKSARLLDPSIINGAQTRGVLEDYFNAHPDDDRFPSVNFEMIVTDDDELIAEISIARNFQNEVSALSIFGSKGRFDELEKAMRRLDPSIVLRKSETDFGDDFLDTEKLIQVLTAMAPSQIPLPSAVKRVQKTAETIYRVYAYRHRSRCLKDFAEVMDDTDTWSEANRFFLDVAVDCWKLYLRLKGEQFFSRLHKVEGDKINGKKIVLPDGVPDGIVFPMLSALSQFIKKNGNRWRLTIPASFPWQTFFTQAESQHKNVAKHNPQTMGKDADCYIALHGTIEMYFAVTKS